MRSPFLSGIKIRSSKSIGIECTKQVFLELLLVLDQLHITGLGLIRGCGAPLLQLKLLAQQLVKVSGQL